jgi:hypothetical protein
MATSGYILGFSTSNYDAMTKFFRDFGFSVAEGSDDQVRPFFEHGRAARITRGALEFQIEESESVDAKAAFNLSLPDFSDEDIERVKDLGYSCEHDESVGGEFHSFHSPDGGIIIV